MRKEGAMERESEGIRGRKRACESERRPRCGVGGRRRTQHGNEWIGVCRRLRLAKAQLVTSRAEVVTARWAGAEGCAGHAV